MAEENQNNQSNPAKVIVNDGANVVKTASSSGKSMVTTTGSTDLTVKKPKTEKQIARERERRRRRRQKKSEVKVLGGQKILGPGEDVPLLILKEGNEAEKLEAPKNVPLSEIVAIDNNKVESEPVKAEPVTEEVVQAEEPVVEIIPPEIPKEVVLEEPVEDVAPVKPINTESSQDIFEESPTYVEETSAEEMKDEPKVEATAVQEDLVEDIPLVHEENFEKENKDKARELHENLFTDESTHLDELPVKQGILGKIFDKFAELVQGRKSHGLPSNMRTNTATIVEEVVSEKPDVSRISSFLANLIKFLILVAFIIGAFWVGSSLKLVDRFSGLFTGGKAVDEAVVGDNSKVVIDPVLLRKWGFETAGEIGKNLGNKNDLGFNSFFNATFFGKLRDPIFFGETGISAAIYYGFAKENEYAQNRFIAYINYLDAIVNANSVNIENVLKLNTRRDIALDKYIKESQEIFEKGNTMRKEINLQVDDLKISINSLGPDKTRYETDFFASISTHEGEKANALLAKFIEAGQKGVELTAKQNAMLKLSQGYENELLKLKIRIQAVLANRDALISGVTVTEVTGGGLGLIKQ